MRPQSLRWSYYFVLSLCLALIFLSFLAYKNTLIALQAWNAGKQLQIFLKADADSAEINELAKKIEGMTNVSRVHVNTREAAAQSLKSNLQSYARELLNDDEWIDLLPQSLEVEVASHLDLQERRELFRRIADDLKSHGLVDEIIDPANWYSKFARINNFIQKVGGGLFLLFVVFLGYFVSLMLKVFIEESKPEIEVYALLGATRWSLYQIFTTELVKWLVFASALGLCISFFIFKIFKTYIAQQGLAVQLTSELKFLTVAEGFFLTALALVFIFAQSFITLKNCLHDLRRLRND